MSQYLTTAYGSPYAGDGDYYLELDYLTSPAGAWFVGWGYWVATADAGATGVLRIEYTDAVGNPTTYYDTSGILVFSSPSAIGFGTVICKQASSTVRVYLTITGSAGPAEAHLAAFT